MGLSLRPEPHLPGVPVSLSARAGPPSRVSGLAPFQHTRARLHSLTDTRAGGAGWDRTAPAPFPDCIPYSLAFAGTRLSDTASLAVIKPIAVATGPGI